MKQKLSKTLINFNFKSNTIYLFFNKKLNLIIKKTSIAI